VLVCFFFWGGERVCVWRGMSKCVQVGVRGRARVGGWRCVYLCACAWACVGVCPGVCACGVRACVGVGIGVSAWSLTLPIDPARRSFSSDCVELRG
jgi:hypothetical protein